ncbi:phosphotransferase enzyme family protein [Nocardia violaceofusca]|uniref:phosphotransferase enzyme family protein n=1 Tax=Nocardia violaceofusca TaxID=941182 RepID=UPI000AFF9001|nr:aminoglycoside phosphotransferase family protein [Nocardia violaceofusca]
MNSPATTSLEAIVTQAAALAGADATGAKLIRTGAHAIYQLRGGIIARIGKPGSADSARRELQISQWLNESGIHTVEAVASMDQPIIVDDRPVTWWRLIPDHRPATPAELGEALRRLHSLTAPPTFTLPEHDPFDGLLETVRFATPLDDDDRKWLIQHEQDLQSGFQRLPAPRRLCVIHGDAWQGNLVVPPSGPPTFLDLDKVSAGRPEWDLIQLAVDHSDFNRLTTADYESFVTAYGGTDMTTNPGFRIYADIQELRWTAFAISLSTRNPRAKTEAAHRIACIRGRIDRPWTWHAF